MHLILLSGGSGKRLWPLSNGARSKQFLKILRAEDGSSESMVQRIYRQLSGSDGDLKWDSVTVVAGAVQTDQLHMQLDESVNIIIEPERRDTFPAIAYAASWLFSEKGVGEDEAVAIMPVDPYVDEHYFNRIAMIENELEITGADIVLLGSKPTYPTEKFGYIIKQTGKTKKMDGTESVPVEGFREKPQIDEAIELISSDALWNCGVFGMKLKYVLDVLKKDYGFKRFDTAYVRKAFSALPKTSFDYAVVESAKNIRVIEYDGSWKDLGTWESLTEEMSDAVIGDVIKDGSTIRSHIINELNIPVVTMGIKNSVVIASPDGILVADKRETKKLKETIASLDTRPMYERKRWGEYFVLNFNSNEDGDTLVKKLVLNKDKKLSYQYHNHRAEVWTIVRGTGVLYLDGEKRSIEAGETVSFSAVVKHGLFAVTDLELIETQFGRPLIEEDVVRLEIEWEPY